MNLIANEQNKRLYHIAGWNGLLLTAWVGTPIHEFSHLIIALLSGHKITEVKLFKPDPRSGSLGYIVHTYQTDNFYQAIIGNTLIAIAPFFGGAFMIYLILHFLLPDFTLYSSDVPRFYHIRSEEIFTLRSYALLGESGLEFIRYIAVKILNREMLSDWKFYASFFVLFGIANHLSPSSTDFKNFWQPLTIIILFMVMINLFILPLTRSSSAIIDTAAQYVLLVMPLLMLAIFISFIGLFFTLLLYYVVSLFR